jgi:GT2 family glycosyltransferase/glycosyltransferase involved in cell wall biosynthesis
MKVLIITENFRTGGLETQILGFCRYLTNSGHEVHLISGVGSRTLPLREIIGDHILEVDMRPNISSKEAIASINRIASYAKEIQPDILHLHPFTSIIYGGIAASLVNKPYVVTIHGPLSLTYGYNITYRIFIDLILRDAWRVFCVSRETAERIKVIVPECHVKILPNGCDTERFKPASMDPSGPVAIIARLDSHKIPGIKSFLSEWAKLGGEPRRPVHIFGEGNSFEELKNWVKVILNGESWITFMGHEDNLHERLKAGYSLVAGMERVVLEAAALNLPIILVGYNGPSGLVSMENCDQLFYRNFSGRHVSVIDAEKLKKELAELEISPERFLLRPWVLEKNDEKKIHAKYLEELANIKASDCKWQEAFLSSIEEAEDTSLFGDKVFHCLLYNLPQDRLNHHWVNLCLAVRLNQTAAEKNNIIMQRDVLSSQLNQTMAEMDNVWNQLNVIYSSNFWKMACRYYKLVDSNFLFRNSHRLLRIIRRRGIAGQESTSSAESRSFTHTNKYDVIFFSIINWDFRYQRPQHIASRFARDGHRVLYVSGDLRKQDAYCVKELTKNIYEITLPFTEENSIYRADMDTDIDLLLTAIGDIFRDFRIKESISFVEFPMWYRLARFARDEYESKIVFDCLDEYAGFGRMNPAIDAHEAALVEEADCCFATSARIFDRLKERSKNTYLVRNATEFGHFSSLPVNDLLKGIKKPIIGYYGAMAEWFDTGLVEYIAENRKDWSIVLIGHTFGSDIDRLRKYRNVHLLAEKAYADLPKYLRWFDVCTIPFKINDLTLSTNPVKFYEYISSGKPVVSTGLPELLPYKEYLYISESKEEFLANIEKALAESDETLIRNRIELAKENDWEGRFEEIKSAIRSSFDMVSINVVTYNCLDYTKQCLESIFAKTAYPNYEVIVIDNASKDGTRDYLLTMKERYGNVKVFLNDNNLGFARANNIGIKESSGKYIILLNNDTIVTRGLIGGIVRYLKDKDIGMVGPVTNSIFNEARVDVTYSSTEGIEDFAEEYTRAHRGEAFEIKTLALYCAGIRRDVIDRVGMLDERYKVGMFEDDDYSLVLRHKGYKVICVRDLFVHHFGQASFSKLKSTEYEKIFNENKKRFEEKWGIGWEPHIHNAKKDDLRTVPLVPRAVASVKMYAKRYMPEAAQRVVKPYYKKYLVSNKKEAAEENEADYIAYQERLKTEFHKNRYGNLVDGFLKDKSYKGTIFYPSPVEWDIPLFQRPHQIFREMSKQGYRVFFLTPNPMADRADPVRQINDRLFIIKDIDMLYALREKSLILWISWTPNIVCREFFPKSKIVYDYTDELEVFGWYCKYMEIDHRKLLRTSDVTIATADNLYSEVKQVRPDVVLVPNGVCTEDFEVAEDKVPADLETIIAGGRLIVGYYGAMAKWLDYDLINFACEECKDLSFVFIGPKLDGSSENLRSFDNLFLLGPKKYHDLKYYLRHFDVATIPFKANKVADSTSPVKLFEYMAGGKPIVTTEMKECAKYQSVLLSKSYREYVANIRKALSLRDDSDYLNILRNEAASNIWASRVETIIKCIEEKN